MPQRELGLASRSLRFLLSIGWGALAIEHCNKCLDDSLFSWERWLIARKVDAGPEQQTQDIEYVHNAIAEKNQEEEFAARIDPVVDTTIRKEAP